MIYLSYSSLQKFFEGECPARWKYGLTMREPESEFSARGIQVHGMMEGSIDPSIVTDKYSIKFYQKLKKLEQAHVNHINSRELWQAFKIAPGVVWRRKIDAVGSWNGNPILIDYKTGSGNWKELKFGEKEYVPQTLTFQGPGYLIPNPAWSPKQKREWPKHMRFLSVGFRGDGHMYEYTRNKADEHNLLDAINHVKSVVKAGRFPKVRGKHCLKCPFSAPCFGADKELWKDMQKDA